MEENVSLMHDHTGYCLNYPLATIPDHLFEGIVKYLTPRTFFNLKQTSKMMHKKCSIFESSVIFWLDKIKIEEDYTVKYYKKGEPMGSDAFLKAQFKLLVNVIQNLGNNEASLLKKIFDGKEVRSGQLYAVNAIHCGTKLFREVIKNLNIFKIVCSSMLPRLQTDEMMQKIVVFISESRQPLEWKNGLLLKNQIEVLHIVGFFFTPQTIHKVLKELVEGKRHINSWCLEKCYFEGVETDKVVKTLFRGWKTIKPEDEPDFVHKRPYVVRKDDELTFRLVCLNGFEFIVDINMGVVIERKFPHEEEEEDEMVEEE